MPIAYGSVRIKKTQILESNENESANSFHYCSICNQNVPKNEAMTCLNPKCLLYSHVICLAKLFVEPGEIIPIEGNCPSCKQDLLWGDLVKKLKGCYKNLEQDEDSSDSEF